MQEVADTLDTSTSTVNKLEEDKKITFFIKYLYFCKNKGEDLNKIFDDDGYKDFVKQIKKKKNKHGKFKKSSRRLSIILF